MMQKTVALFVLLSVLLYACEDVIDIDLNTADPQLVIVGEVSNHTNVQRVELSRTVSFDEENVFDPVSGATVRVMDGTGKTFSYTEAEPGVYLSHDFQGQEHERYELLVHIGGEEYTAVSTMPRQVTADSVGTTVQNFFGEEEKLVTVVYQDPPGVSNYYRYLMSVDGSPFKMKQVSRDKFNDGKYVSENLFDPNLELKEGDEVTIRMQCIDKPAFEFWNVIQSGNRGAAAPANPPSAFGNRALGYFSAHAMTEISMTVQ